jgi:hypothetical protein
MAQLKVDASGRSIFGKQLTFDKGISIVDESTSTNPMPFRITRKTNNDILFSRTSTSAGLVIQSYGNVLMGNSLPSSVSPDYIPLRIYTNYFPGAEIFMTSSNRTINTNKTLNNCIDAFIQDVTITNNAKLSIDAQNKTIVNSNFEVTLGSELEIK